MHQIRKASALAVAVIAVSGGAVLSAPAATADARPATGGRFATSMDPGPPDCNAGTSGDYWTDPWSGRQYRCMLDRGYWTWVDIS